MRKLNSKIFLIAIILLNIPFFVSANYQGQIVKFFIDPSYDSLRKEEIFAVLVKISSKLLFYVDNNWWSTQNPLQQDETKRSLDALAIEFEGKIYPSLFATFGSEWMTGIDKDNRITVLIHPMKEEAGGYFNNGDEYPKAQNPKSNEREMIYLNAEYITDS